MTSTVFATATDPTCVTVSGGVSSRDRTPLQMPTLYDKCMALARNLSWTWSPEVITLFQDIDPIRWRALDHNPIALLSEFAPDELNARVAELVMQSRIHQAYRRLKEYLATTPSWSKSHTGVLGSMPVAYFSMEFGIHESVPIYSGGLGILSGDHIKSASGLGVPMVAVGLFYHQGYFRQHLDADGYQREEYLAAKVEHLPVEPVVGPGGEPLTVAVDTRSGRLFARVWLMRVGRVNLYLLDCDVEGNNAADRDLTSRLYGGGDRTRIRQELVAGVGGVRALNALGITPGAYHLNEGHVGFAALEVVRQRMRHEGMRFEDALEDVAEQTVFTTHTPVPAGHDRFRGELVEEHLGPLREELGISHERLMGLGRVQEHDPQETFCMTVLGLKLSRRANGVSALHGRVSRGMWAPLWPGRAVHEVPIGHITNGVHVPSWLAWQMKLLFDRHFPADWYERMGEPEVWQYIHAVDPGELWETHHTLKNLLLSFVRRRISRDCRRRKESEEATESARQVLDPDVLTIGFGRRFATYKRADLILRDLDRTASLLNDPDRPLQLIFAGKAHPADEAGKQLVRKIANLRRDSRFARRVVFVEDYDINVARHLIQGVDVWLNNPRRPLEASGTSGQKAVLNGALNLSVLDGWWAEAFDGSNGFAIGAGRRHADDGVTDARDAEDLYRVLRDEVIPLYYDRDIDGLPRSWIKRMMNSVSSLAWRFSAHRMVADYVRHAYVPAAGGLSCDMKAR
ncbi:MAG: glycosyltransferase family 1 protein [Planctomycetes bacterium]|nr:glycosyltransferase family 1 protein [Planctomycetota bacterium]